MLNQPAADTYSMSKWGGKPTYTTPGNSESAARGGLEHNKTGENVVLIFFRIFST